MEGPRAQRRKEGEVRRDEEEPDGGVGQKVGGVGAGGWKRRGGEFKVWSGRPAIVTPWGGCSF